MKLLQFVPIKLTFFLILGILMGYYFNIDLYLSLILTIIFLTALGIVFLRQKKTNSSVFGIMAFFVTISIGILSVSLNQPINSHDHYSHYKDDADQTWHLKIMEVQKPTFFSDRYIVSVIGLDDTKVSGKLLLNIDKDSTREKLLVDDELMAWSTLKDVNPPLNPHQFDYKKYLENLGIYHQVQLKSKEYFKKENPSKTIFGIAARLRNHIISKLKEADFGEEELGIIQALLLGQRNDIGAETYNNYKNAGAVHILAVSGLHIGILLLLLQFLLRPLELLPKGKTIKLVVIVLLLWAFALLAGMSASVIRAVTMFSFVAYALYLNRPGNTFNILALSMFFILLLINPMLLFQVGFQMSYAAVFAIVWIYPKLQQFWFPKNLIVRKIWQLLSVSLAAQLGVLPIGLYYFHQFPGLFFVSNLLVVPFLGLILGMGILVIALALINSLPVFLASLYNSLIHWMNSVIGLVAQQEAFIFKDIPFDFPKLVLSYGIVCGLVYALTKITFKRLAFLLVCIIGFQLWIVYCNYHIGKKEKLMVLHKTRNTVVFHQTGQKLQVMATDSIGLGNISTDYKVGENIDLITHVPLENVYDIDNKKIYIMDSLGIYPPTNLKPEYILLSQSPKIHLERLIDSIQPKTIIADGSNYRSYVDRWKKTCKKRKLPFRYTGEKGAYFFDMKD